MKNLRIFMLLFGVLTLVSKYSYATHISGIDFNYQCVGQDSFLVTFNMFRDCSGNLVGNTASVNFSSTCGGSFTASLPLQTGYPTEVSQLCASNITNSSCNGGSLPGMEKYVFSGIVVLSPACNDWTMSWSLCCRNSSVNLVGQTNAYISASLSSGNDACNNSPNFNATYIPYVCINQPINYNLGVTEPDGDSLHYSFEAPYNFLNDTVIYNPGYSYNNPIPGISLNPTTGQLTFTPMQVGNFVVAVKVCEYEYGTGVLKGCVIREFQFVVINCSNVPPQPPIGISNLQGAAVQVAPDSVELCVGNNFSFDLVFTDFNSLDSVTLFSNISSVLPGATFSTSNGNPATITVSWTAIAGSLPFYSFSVTAMDDACPIPGIVSASYNVIVVPSTYAGPDLTICQGTQWAQPVAVGGSQFLWTVLSGQAIDTVPTSPTYNATCHHCKSPQFSPLATTTYIVTSNLSGTCVNVDTFVVNVVPDFQLYMPNDTLICSADDYPLMISTNQPSYSYSYQWSPSSSLNNDTVPIPNANPVDPTQYTVTVTSSSGCKKSGSVNIDLSPPFPGNMQITGDTVVCMGQTTQLGIDYGSLTYGSCGPTTQSCLGTVQDGVIGTGTLTNSVSGYPAIYGGQHWGAKHLILYRATELANMGMTGGGFINSIAFYSNTLSNVTGYTDFTIRMGCTSEVDLSNGWVNPGTMTTVFYDTLYSPSVGWNVHNFSTSYNWDGSSNLVFEICFNNVGSGNNATMPYTATGYQSVLYQYGNVSSICNTYSSLNTGGTILSNKRPNTKFNYCSGVDPNALTYIWSPNVGLNSNSISNPLASPQGNVTYQLIVEDSMGICKDTLSHHVDVVTQFNAGFISQSPYCVNDSADVFLPLVGNGTFYGSGINSLGVFDPANAGIGIWPINYSITSPALCANDSTINIEVIGLPDASVAYSEVCIGGDTITLNPATPGGVFSGPGIIDPIAGIFDPVGLWAGTYNVAYTLTQPCFNSDTIGVKVIEPYNFTFNQNIVGVCQDHTVDLSGNYTLSSNPNQGNGPTLAIWGDANGYIDTSTGIFDATGVPNGDYVITLSITGQDGSCGNTKAMTVKVLRLDYPTFLNDLTFCKTDGLVKIQLSPPLFNNNSSYSQTPLSPLTSADTLSISQISSIDRDGQFNTMQSPVGSWEISVGLTNSYGCTGVITDTISVLPKPTNNSVIQNQTVLQAVLGGYNYQWYDCDNNMALVPGATKQVFTPAVTGNYAVEIYAGNCSIMSNCYYGWSLGIENLESDYGITMFPNPTKQFVEFKFENEVPELVEIFDFTGKCVFSSNQNSPILNVDMGGFSNGMYVVRFHLQKNTVNLKIIKN